MDGFGRTLVLALVLSLTVFSLAAAAVSIDGGARAAVAAANREAIEQARGECNVITDRVSRNSCLAALAAATRRVDALPVKANTAASAAVGLRVAARARDCQAAPDENRTDCFKELRQAAQDGVKALQERHDELRQERAAKLTARLGERYEKALEQREARLLNAQNKYAAAKARLEVWREKKLAELTPREREEYRAAVSANVAAYLDSLDALADRLEAGGASAELVADIRAFVNESKADWSAAGTVDEKKAVVSSIRAQWALFKERINKEYLAMDVGRATVKARLMLSRANVAITALGEAGVNLTVLSNISANIDAKITALESGNYSLQETRLRLINLNRAFTKLKVALNRAIAGQAVHELSASVAADIPAQGKALENDGGAPDDDAVVTVNSGFVASAGAAAAGGDGESGEGSEADEDGGGVNPTPSATPTPSAEPSPTGIPANASINVSVTASIA